VDHNDLTWTQLENSWDRLRWARLRKHGTAKAAADALGLEPGTYAAYERPPEASKHIPLTYDRAVHFGSRFGVRWEWLLNRQGKPWLEETPGDRVKRLVDAQPAERQEAFVAALEQLLRTGS
jgi:transcriptional regulator with XRE-family HTH domain